MPHPLPSETVELSLRPTIGVQSGAANGWRHAVNAGLSRTK